MRPHPPALRLALLSAAVALLVAACSRHDDSSAPRTGSGKGLAFASMSYDQALAKARDEKKLVLVDVYTDWCGWCKKMERDVFADERVGSAAGNLLAVRVNAEKGGEEVADRFGVRGFPTILFVDGDGRLVRKVEGYVPVEEMLKVLGRLPRPSA